MSRIKFKIFPSNIILYGWILLPLTIIFALSLYSGLYASNQKINISHSEKNSNLIFKPKSEYQWQSTPLITFWLDDGWLSEYQVGAEYLRSQDLVGSMAIVTNYVNYPGYVTWPQIKRIAHWGWEISAHSKTHQCNPDQMSKEALENEIVDSKKTLESYGFQTNTYVAPCGVITSDMVLLAKENFNSLRGTTAGVNPLPVQDRYNIKSISMTPQTTVSDMDYWIKTAKESKSWLIIVIHQIDNSGDQYSISPSQFETTVSQVKKSGIPVVLPSQALGIKNK